MTQHHYIIISSKSPSERKQLGYPKTIGPIEHLTLQVVQHTMEPNQLPANTAFDVWPFPDAVPASTAKTTSARKASARKTSGKKATATTASAKHSSAKKAAARPGKRTMSAATKKKISESQRRRLAAKKANGAVGGG